MRSTVSAVLAFGFLVPVFGGGAQTLEGAIDMHAHAAPDGTPRKLDAARKNPARLLGLAP